MVSLISVVSPFYLLIIREPSSITFPTVIFSYPNVIQEQVTSLTVIRGDKTFEIDLPTVN